MSATMAITFTEPVTSGSSTVFRRPLSHDDTQNATANEPKVATTLATFKDQQSNILPHEKLMIVFPTIALAQMISQARR